MMCKENIPYWDHCHCVVGSVIYSDEYWMIESLATQIKSWMGSQYTMVFVDVEGGYPLFLKSSEYRSSKDSERPILLSSGPLCKMYSDWVRSGMSRCLCMPGLRRPCFDLGFTSRLPKPCSDRVDRWKVDAIAAIKADVDSFDTIEEWREYWEPFYIVAFNEDLFDSMFSDFELDRISEGLRLLGL